MPVADGDPKRPNFSDVLGCLVNGKQGRNGTPVLAYEPDETYTVWLAEGHDGRTAESMVLACHLDVCCDTLQITIEGAYDEAIRRHNEGFIPLD